MLSTNLNISQRDKLDDLGSTIAHQEIRRRIIEDEHSHIEIYTQTYRIYGWCCSSYGYNNG